MKTFRLIGMALLAIVLCVNFASCSSDDDEDSTLKLLQGVWYDANTDGYPYFIVEKDHCYFSDQPSTVNYDEKYKYTFDSKTNILYCYGYNSEENTYDDDAWLIRVKSISNTNLTIELLDEDDNQTVRDTRNCTRK